MPEKLLGLRFRGVAFGGGGRVLQSGRPVESRGVGSGCSSCCGCPFGLFLSETQGLHLGCMRCSSAVAMVVVSSCSMVGGGLAGFSSNDWFGGLGR